MKWTLILLLTLTSLWSAPALNVKRQFQQPDGTTFTGRQQGDEYLNWIETEDGDILRFNKKQKRFEYAIIKEKKLMHSGEQYHPLDKMDKAAPLHPKITKDQLRKLWQEERKKAAKKRKH
ncbi:MAG: hypothetical protein U9Q62_02215 [Campylobacterota bacterium]|nr:hypothetical protein [Campylobacterota bacterium]